LKGDSFNSPKIAASPPFNYANSLGARRIAVLARPKSRQARGIGYPSETGIDNPVAAIGDKNVPSLPFRTTICPETLCASASPIARRVAARPNGTT
jgi:hypothetical protein